jgi:hypothetical protein
LITFNPTPTIIHEDNNYFLINLQIETERTKSKKVMRIPQINYARKLGN